MSVVILTLNEANNIGPCLDSCAWSDDVHVLDSGSTDETVRRSEAGGARVWLNKFESFGKQRNWAIDHIPLKHDWVFHLDADERFTEPLVREMTGELAKTPGHAGYLVANQMLLMNRWIKRSSGYPAYQVRLFHKDRLRFTDSGHGQREDTTGSVATLNEPYVHENFSKGLAEWLERHNRYSTREAAQIVADTGEKARLGDLFKGGIARRRAMKRVFSKMPCRPTVRFMHALFVQGGILDGKAGVQYARLLSIYETMIALKVSELRAKRGA